MKIKVLADKSLKNVWDIQRAKKVLEMLGLSSEGVSGISQKEVKEWEKKITLYLWDNIKKQFPQIEKFCNEKKGGFNKIEERNFNTPITNIFGDFYLQLIGQNNKNEWIWESVSLEPYRFEFNEEGYFKGLVVDAINKLITQGYNKKEDFKRLIKALNEYPHKEKVLTIKTKGKDLGKVDLKEVETKII